MQRDGLFERARELWRSSPWKWRIPFTAVAALFIARALHVPRGSPDRLGFLRIGAGVLDGVPCRDPLLNTYPPTFAVLMAPVAALARLVGDLPVRLLWGAGQLAALVVATVCFARAMRLRLTLASVAIAWLCIARYVVSDLNNQNVTLFLVAAVAVALDQMVGGRETRGAALLGFAASLKVWPAYPAVALASSATGRRPMAGLLSGAMVTVAATGAVLGPHRALDAWTFWFREVIPRAGDLSLLNQSLRAVALRAAHSSNAVIPGGLDVATRATGWATLAAALAFFRARRPESPRVVVLDAALASLLGLMCLPFVWVHYFAVGMPVVLAVVCTHEETGTGAMATALLVLGVALAELFDVDLVGRSAWSLAAFWGNAFAGNLLVLAAGFALRSRWQEQDCTRAEDTSAAVPSTLAAQSWRSRRTSPV